MFFVIKSLCHTSHANNPKNLFTYFTLRSGLSMYFVIHSLFIQPALTSSELSKNSLHKSWPCVFQRFNAEHHVIHLENYLSELPKAISIIKLPFWDLHWYYVVKKSSSLSKKGKSLL